MNPGHKVNCLIKVKFYFGQRPVVRDLNWLVIIKIKIKIKIKIILKAARIESKERNKLKILKKKIKIKEKPQKKIVQMQARAPSCRLR